MTAEQAKALTKKNAEKPRNQYMEIQSLIENETRKDSPNDYVWYYRPLCKVDQSLLVSEGFRVSTQYDRGDTLVKISW